MCVQAIFDAAVAPSCTGQAWKIAPPTGRRLWTQHAGTKISERWVELHISRPAIELRDTG